MSTQNNDKKGTGNTGSTSKPESTKDQASSGKKGMEQGKDEMKKDPTAKATDKDSDTKKK